MDINFSTLVPCILDKLNRVVEDTCNILLGVISQVVRLVDDSIVLVVVFRVVCSTIDHMSDSKFLKRFLIPCDEITTKVQESIDDLRANHLEELVLIFLPSRPLVVKVFIVELLWRNEVVLHPISVTINSTITI